MCDLNADIEELEKQIKSLNLLYESMRDILEIDDYFKEDMLDKIETEIKNIKEEIEDKKSRLEIPMGF